jgi:predicted nucleotidyltransferase
MTRLELIIGQRTKARAADARAAAASILANLRLEGFDAALIGSLARGDFKDHSDIDFLIRGDVSASARAQTERIVSSAGGPTGIPCGIVFLEDLPPDGRSEFEADVCT